ncbi:hypothetical protein [Streptomyces buecherae]|uniref:Uncharacterized protein n=1 Tax=Streptomyces buecherae TaxID=2763006 RepID=A0A7H8NKA6_9ACTN|nr:hypothetical protein [Streptomyces buecherae]QKW55027.1 hypothetical protein HUT08_36465 [Streptomyces buecherae]
MSEALASHLRTLAADVEALQRRLHDAVALTGPTGSFQLGDAFASLGEAVRTLEAAASQAAGDGP